MFILIKQIKRSSRIFPETEMIKTRTIKSTEIKMTWYILIVFRNNNNNKKKRVCFDNLEKHGKNVFYTSCVGKTMIENLL